MNNKKLGIYVKNLNAYLAVDVITHVPHGYKGIKHGLAITGRHKVLSSHHCGYCPAASKTRIFTFIH